MRRKPSPPLLLPLLFLALCFQLGPAIADRSPQEVLAEVEYRHGLELSLTHMPIDRIVLGALPVWDEKTGQLRLRVQSENFDDSRPILILHLWATWCEPCKEEMPLWRELQARMNKLHNYEVRIVHIAMQKDAKEMAGFVRQLGDKMPFETKYFDRDERLEKLLRPAFRGKELPTLPITLWLGPARTVRQAMVGTISNRAGAVMESTEQLLHSIHYLRDEVKKPLPKEEEIDTFSRPAPCQCPCICN